MGDLKKRRDDTVLSTQPTYSHNMFVEFVYGIAVVHTIVFIEVWSKKVI